MSFATEAEMVASWLRQIAKAKDWTPYPETAGWDVLLVHACGAQLGIQAKLSLNAKVLAQTLEGASSFYRASGPDYRGVLVPEGKAQNHLSPIASALGIEVVTVHRERRGVTYGHRLPDPTYKGDYPTGMWPNWLPERRETLPEYIPDVVAGAPSPLQLTPWKIAAIKLLIVLDLRGHVTRADIKALKLHPSRWCDKWAGLLSAGEAGYVRNSRTPNFKTSMATNWVQIEADWATWSKVLSDAEALSDLRARLAVAA